MGHVINPVSQRVGETRFWDSNWALTKPSLANSYSYTNTQGLLILKYSKRLVQVLTKKLFGRGLLVLGLRLLKTFSQTTLFIEVSMKQLQNISNILTFALKNSFSLINVVHKSRPRPTISAPDLTTVKKLFTKPRFIRQTYRMTKYIASHNKPDPLAYVWLAMTNTLALVKKTALINKETNNFYFQSITASLLNSILVTYWARQLGDMLSYNLRLLFYKPSPITTIVSLLSVNSITASFVANYLSTRLLQKFPLRRLINLIIRQLQYAQLSGAIQGFKIACNGRFERRGRATHTWKVIGRLPKSDVNTTVDYSIMLPVLTNSICAVKVWIVKNNIAIRNTLL